MQQRAALSSPHHWGKHPSCADSWEAIAIAQDCSHGVAPGATANSASCGYRGHLFAVESAAISNASARPDNMAQSLRMPAIQALGECA
jgi:hypothetical protein